VKRLFDLALALFLLPFLILPMILIALAVKITSKGPVLYWSQRVGVANSLFSMPKFRTMRTDTPEVATHLLKAPDTYLTRIGPFLRKTSLDEVPQIYNVLRGELRFVGPRPALHNQYDLVKLRTERGIHTLPPGLTGWAQVNGRDELSIASKVEFDHQYAEKQSFLFDLEILFLTFVKVATRAGVKH
jgi:O-antigen biosynthesis protein WbqP